MAVSTFQEKTQLDRHLFFRLRAISDVISLRKVWRRQRPMDACSICWTASTKSASDIVLGNMNSQKIPNCETN
jgi:hypothetical protein